MAASQASLLLQKQLKDLCKHPLDGFSAGLIDESNVFAWSVTIISPPDAVYDVGFFNVIISFPFDYSQSPPKVKSIVLSTISMLSSPNDESPAHVKVLVCCMLMLHKEWRENRDEFRKRVGRRVRKLQEMIQRAPDGINLGSGN